MERPKRVLRAREKAVLLDRPRLMGVLNVTPDSFYDGGRHLNAVQAVEHGLRLEDQGADILDIGGESSRPGSEPVSSAEELSRVVPVIEELARRVSLPLSVDTTKSEVARQALESGADIVNDISALSFDPKMAETVAHFEAAVVLMHMRGRPKTMQQLPPSRDILSRIRKDLQKALERADTAGIARDRIVLDPGIGFGKTVAQNLRILNRLQFLADFDLPILVGTSRKSFIGKILDRPEEERLWGTAASVAVAVIHGADLLRVHDVSEMRMVARVAAAIRQQ